MFPAKRPNGATFITVKRIKKSHISLLVSARRALMFHIVSKELIFSHTYPSQETC